MNGQGTVGDSSGGAGGRGSLGHPRPRTVAPEFERTCPGGRAETHEL